MGSPRRIRNTHREPIQQSVVALRRRKVDRLTQVISLSTREIVEQCGCSIVKSILDIGITRSRE